MHFTNDIISKIYNSMLFNITENMRFISVDILNNKLNCLAYFKHLPTESDKDCIYSILGEAEGYFKDLSTGNCEIVISNEPYDKLKHLPHLIYAIYEGPSY